ncbi:MAG TPA: hypothetical protein VK729_08690 [Silvibacterium sp.]|jgi:hypothetical protein|nr:hypothetical protein [Silvibacterium sp.]
MSTNKTSSHLHGTLSKKMPRTTWLLIMCCLPVIVLAVYFTPLLVSLSWHVMHGASINYRGLRVRVPMGWTVDINTLKEDFPANPQGITLEKQPKTLSLIAPGQESMYFNLLLPDGRSTPTQQVAQWESLFRQSHSTSDFDIVRRNDLHPDMNCLEAIPHGIPSAAALACISLEHGWVAEFAGSQGNVPLFLQVAGALKRKT